MTVTTPPTPPGAPAPQPVPPVPAPGTPLVRPSVGDEAMAGLQQVHDGDGTVWDLSTVSETTPDYLVPQMDLEAVSTPTFYRQLVIHDPGAPDAAGEPITRPLDPFAPASELPLPGEPLEGALLTYEQGWHEKGLALGRLLHSTCLAPGEVTRIAITSFRRQSAGSTSESAEQRDAVASETDQTSAVYETQQVVGRESQNGSSFQAAAASQSQAAISGGGLFVAGSASTALNAAMGVSVASSASASDVAANGSRDLSQRTVAASNAVRGRRAAQVREAFEGEEQSASTRVIANYNHMHAMTMMFFEVLQVYALETNVVHAERVVFLPMADIHFDREFVRRNVSVLRETLALAGVTGLDALFAGYLAADLGALEDEEHGRARVLEDRIAVEFGPVDNDPRFAYPDYPGLPNVLTAFTRQLETQSAQQAQQLVRLSQGQGPGPGEPSLQEIGADLERTRKFISEVSDAYGALIRVRAEFLTARQLLDRLEEHRQAVQTVLWMTLDAGLVQRLVLPEKP